MRLPALRLSAILCLSSLAVTASLVASAAPTSRPDRDTRLITSAVGAVKAPTAVDTATATLPSRGDEPARLKVKRGQLELTVPGRGESTTVTDGSAVFKGSKAKTSVAVQELPGALRALVVIEDSSAPEDFHFDLGGVVHKLTLDGKGGVDAWDDNGELVATAAAPWAVDASGTAVPTYYRVAGTTLTQIVKHRNGDFRYGIVADPTFLQVTKCAAAITVAVGSTIFAAAKILKIRKIIRAAGGVRAAAARVIKSYRARGSFSAKARAGFADLGSAAVAAAVVVLDIDTIQANCSF